MKWYENHRHNWSYCHDLRFWISFYFLCGWEAVEYGEIPPFCVYAICLISKVLFLWGEYGRISFENVSMLNHCHKFARSTDIVSNNYLIIPIVETTRLWCAHWSVAYHAHSAVYEYGVVFRIVWDEKSAANGVELCTINIISTGTLRLRLFHVYVQKSLTQFQTLSLSLSISHSLSLDMLNNFYLKVGLIR